MSLTLSDLRRVLEPVMRRLRLLAGRAIVALVEESRGERTLQMGLLAGEQSQGIEQMQEYGFASQPIRGCEALVIFQNGDRSHGVAVATDDPRYRPLGLEPGEVCLYNLADVTGAEEEPLVMPEGALPEGAFWPSPPDDPESLARAPRCRVSLKPGRRIQIVGEGLSITATGDATVMGGGSLTLAAATALNLNAPAIKLGPLGQEVEVGGEMPRLARVGDHVEVGVEGTIYCGQIVDHCTQG